MRNFRKKNPIKKMLWNARSRSKKKGYECNISEQDISIPEHCPITGNKIDIHSSDGNRLNWPTLDRIDNSKGYIKGNVAVISWRANQLKNNASLEELRRLYEYALSANT